MDIDTVAEAIWEASPGTLPWREVPDDSITKGHYRRMAQAAIDALQLANETAFLYTHNASGRSTIIESTSADVHMARKIAGTTHTLTQVARLVTPWADGSES